MFLYVPRYDGDNSACALIDAVHVRRRCTANDLPTKTSCSARSKHAHCKFEGAPLKEAYAIRAEV